MKPPVLITNASRLYAGGEFFVLLLAVELRRRGFDAAVSCRDDNLLAGKCRDAGVPVDPVPFPEKGGLRKVVAALRAIIERRRPVIVHTNTNYDRTAGALAARLSDAKHVASVHSFHSISHNITHALRNRFWTDAFIVLGDGAKRMLMEDGVPAEKITIVPLGLDPGTMRRSEEQRTAARAALGLRPGELLLGNVGRLVPFKGQEFLLHAFAHVNAARPHVRLAIVGDGELEEHLRRLAADLGIADRIIFTGFRDDIPALYSAMDVYVHSSVEGGGETFPFAVLQSLAFGLPSVVTAVGEVGSIAEDGVTGFTVPDRDPERFARALAKLLDDGTLRAAMGRAARERLMRKYTVGTMADGVEEVYRRVALEPGNGPPVVF